MMCLVWKLNIAKTFLTTKTNCVIIHYPIAIYLSVLFFHGLHVMVRIVNSLSLCDLVWWRACYTATGALAPGRINHAGQVKE